VDKGDTKKKQKNRWSKKSVKDVIGLEGRRARKIAQKLKETQKSFKLEIGRKRI